MIVELIRTINKLTPLRLKKEGGNVSRNSNYHYIFSTETTTTSHIFFACGEHNISKFFRLRSAQLIKYFSPAARTTYQIFFACGEHNISNIFRLRRTISQIFFTSCISHNISSQIFFACGAHNISSQIFFACGAHNISP